jgi:hypothetical protein
LPIRRNAHQKQKDDHQGTNQQKMTTKMCTPRRWPL